VAKEVLVDKVVLADKEGKEVSFSFHSYLNFEDS